MYVPVSLNSSRQKTENDGVIDKEHPAWWKVALFGSFAPGASQRWRRERRIYAVGLAVVVLAVWGVGEVVVHLV